MIEAFNAAQGAIDKFAKDTSAVLTKDAFGAALREAAKNVKNLGDRIEKFNEHVGNQIEKLVKAINSEKVANKIDGFLKALDNAINHLGGNDSGNGGGRRNGASDVTRMQGRNATDMAHVMITKGQNTYLQPPVTVVVHGDVLTEGQLVDKIHEGLLKKQKRVPLGINSK